jgi:hypothetical protein
MPQTVLQMGLQLWIDLNGNDTSRFGAQTGGQGAPPRSDLQDSVLRTERRQGHDLADNVRIDEEILTEPFQGWGKRGRHNTVRPPSRRPEGPRPECVWQASRGRSDTFPPRR